ncbi:MAG: LPS export ABC transporter periplasmic protein LptC [Rhodobacteraceae bacterium]|nr:LPS export ABC transporter periplasmic protein LptC [Paracoccaceae bacterium]
MRFLAIVTVLTWAVSAQAQGTQIQFGTVGQDTGQPVEIAADALQVSQEDATAIFTGQVEVIQGDMRLAAGTLRVEYAEADGEQDTGRIARLVAGEGVTLTSGGDTAEAKDAIYDIDSGQIEMTGNVMLTQGRNTMSSGRMVVNLETGTARLDGRVRTILQTGRN